MTSHRAPVLDQESYQVVLDVIDGNPGACVIVGRLLSSPFWRLILYSLKAQCLVGSELWRVVQDDYAHDWSRFVKDQLQTSYD
jgi:hypothetical protein